MSNAKSIRPMRSWLLRQVAVALLLPGACCVLAACTTESSETYATSRPGDSLEKDPLGYNLKPEELNISGGGLNNYDKNAMHKDLDDVFNP